MKNDLKLSSSEIDFILSPPAIRDRAKKIFALTEQGKGSFVYHPDKLVSTVKYVLDVIWKNYPTLDIPFHSRWGHFRAGGEDRVKILDEKLSPLKPLERARVKIDLVIPSVLLDAGAGPKWKYRDEEGKYYGRSEGLGLASFYMFLDGALSATGRALRAEKDGLRKLSAARLEEAFQVSPSNPLVGVAGRVQLLNNLADALENKEIFAKGRPGDLVDYLVSKYGQEVPAVGLLRAVLDGLGPIWPGRIEVEGKNLGDVWRHSGLGSGIDALVPFHKLSQWLTYSLIEPIEEAGLRVTGAEELTGLAEYRNGGLFLDSGLLSFRNPSDAEKSWTPDSELIIEWRALTIYFLDIVGREVQKALGKTPQNFPLAKVLEGGTWWAGRFLAQEKRSGGEPPIKIQSDGTVF
ncbi:MAG: URC4/urg3 family protein [Bdellovibrionota bacterium]